MYSRGKTIARLVNSIDQFSCQSRVGDILVSVNRDAYSGIAFHQDFKLFKKAIHKLFDKGVSVVTRSDSGRLHCHIAVEMKEVCTGFDWTSFNEAERYYKLYKLYKDKDNLKFYHYFTNKYKASLPNSWKIINRKLLMLGKHHGMGRVFLTSVKKNLEALKWYYVSNIPYTRDDRDRGVQYFCSWGMTRLTGFQVFNRFTRAYRNRLRRFAEGLQLDSENYNIALRSVLGQRWYFRCKDLIRDIDNLSTKQVMLYNELRSTIRTYLLRSS